MKFLKRIVVGLVATIAVLCAVAYALPREVRVARSIDIDALPSDIYPHIASLKANAEWSPWLGRDPQVKLTYSGPDSGVGSKLEWASDNPQVGQGKQEITEAIPNEKVVTALDFGDMGTAEAALLISKQSEGDMSSTVTWTLDTDMGNSPIGRWMGLMMDRWVGADYEAGLGKLKSLVKG